MLRQGRLEESQWSGSTPDHANTPSALIEDGSESRADFALTYSCSCFFVHAAVEIVLCTSEKRQKRSKTQSVYSDRFLKIVIRTIPHTPPSTGQRPRHHELSTQGLSHAHTDSSTETLRTKIATIKFRPRSVTLQSVSFASYQTPTESRRRCSAAYSVAPSTIASTALTRLPHDHHHLARRHKRTGRYTTLHKILRLFRYAFNRRKAYYNHDIAQL